MAVAGLSEAITMTQSNRSGVLADNVTKNTALLFKLRKRGNVKPYGGGRSIVQELNFRENSTFAYYSGAETLNTAATEVFTAAEFNMKQAAVAVTMTGKEMLENAGEEQVIDLLDARMENAEITLLNNIGIDCYSDGTGDGGKQIGGLQLLIADSPSTGTVGGIDRSSWTFWRNIANGTASALSATNIVTNMNTVYNQLVRNAEKPDLVCADNTAYRLYEESLQAIQRIADPEMADAGFESLKYKGAAVCLDGGVDGGAPSSHMYFVNTKYLHFRPHRDRNFVPIGGERESQNQDVIVKFIGWAGNLTLSNAYLQGVLFDNS